MSKKPANKRLDKLFDDLETVETPNPVEQEHGNGNGRSGIKTKMDVRGRKPTLSIANKPKSGAQVESRLPVNTQTDSGSDASPASMALAFRLDEQNWATLKVVDNSAPRSWDTEEQMLVKQVADQLSLALENARLFQETQSRAEELAVLNEMGQVLSSLLDANEIIENIYKYSSRFFDTTNFYVALYDPNSDELSFPLAYKAGVREEWATRKPRNGMTEYVLMNKKSLLISERVEEIVQDLKIQSQQAKSKSWLGVPLLVANQSIGVISVQDYSHTHTFDEHIRDLLEAIASQSAIAIQNARLFVEVDQRSKDVALINRVVSAVASTSSLEETLEEVARELTVALGGQRALAALLDESGESLSIVAQYSDDPNEPGTVGLPIPLKDNPAMKQVVDTARYESFDDVQNSTAFSKRFITQFKARDIGSALVMPIVVDAKTIGVIGIDISEKTANISEQGLNLARTVLAEIASSVERMRAEEALARNEAMLKTVIDSTPDWIFIKDRQHRYQLVNKGYSDSMKIPADEFIDKDDIELGFPEEIVKGDAEKNIRGFWPDDDEVFDSGEMKVVDVEPAVVNDEQRFLSTTKVPLKNSQGDVWGVLGFVHDITEREQLLANVERRSIELQTAAEVSQAVSSITSLEELLPQSVELIRSRFDLYYVGIFLLDDERKYAILRAGTGDAGKAMLDRNHRLAINEQSMIGWSVTNAQARIALDVGEDAVRFENPLLPETHSELALPLITRGQVLGAMTVQSTEQAAFTEDNIVVLQTMANQLANAIANAALITEITAAQEATQQNEALLQTVINSTPDWIFIKDKEHRIRLANKGYSDSMKIPVEEMLGKNDLELGFPEEIVKGDPEKGIRGFWPDDDEVMESGEIKIVDIEPAVVDDEERFLTTTKVPLKNQQGEVWGVLGFVHDITDIKQAEVNLRRQYTYLEAAAKIGRLVTSTLDLDTLFTQTVNLVGDQFGFYHAAIFTLDESGFNAILREATGKVGETMKQQQHTLNVGSKSVIGNVTSTGKPMIVNNTAIDPIHRPNPLLPETRAEAGFPLRVGERIIGAIDIQSQEVEAFTQDDVSVLQTLADQIAIAIDNARSYELAQQAIKDMRELDRLKSQFLANMSHELRTPLNSIIGFSRVILKGIDGPVTELQQQDLSAIYNSGQHLLGLINDILDLSKIEAGKMELAFEDVNMRDVVKSVLSTATGLVKDKPIKLVQNVPSELPIIRADGMRIRQVMINLLSNAAKFTDEGSITVDVAEKTTTAGQRELMISVTDTGPGISLADQSKLFQPFSQVDSSPTRKTGGTGLGLSISNQLVQLHGGRMGVHSAPGKGSTFYFTLPVDGEGQEPVEEQDNNGKVILAIDDDPQVIGLYERYLQPQGFKVIALTDPSKAKEEVARVKPFAVTLDIMMPGRDGWNVIQELKSSSETRDVPVIICSIVEETEKGFSLGAADYLVKPILEEDLVNALNRINGDGSIHDVLVIDDDADDLRLLGKMLNDDGNYKPVLMEGGKNGWNSINKKHPDAIVLDLFMPDMDGFTILEKLSSNSKLRDIPVIVVSGAELTAKQQKQLKELGQRLFQKSALSQDELLDTLEKALKRVTPQPEK
jgi:PAS domain S-box-containing protein